MHDFESLHQLTVVVAPDNATGQRGLLGTSRDSVDADGPLLYRSFIAGNRAVGHISAGLTDSDSPAGMPGRVVGNKAMHDDIAIS
jgi:hypothetical protein